MAIRSKVITKEEIGIIVSNLEKEVVNISDGLSKFWEEILFSPTEEKGKYFNKILDDILGDKNQLDEQQLILNHLKNDKSDEVQSMALMRASFTSCAYTVRARRELNNNNNDYYSVLRSISNANYWLGIVIGAWSTRRHKPISMREFSLRGAAARHNENYEMKDDVFKWLDEHMDEYKRIDSAAIEIAGNIVPIALSTAQKWIKEWKKMHSAGRR